MNKPVRIDKNVPIPTPCGRGRLEIPWESMEVGDSFATADKYIRAQAFRAGVKFGLKFTTRKTQEGIRVWRIA